MNESHTPSLFCNSHDFATIQLCIDSLALAGLESCFARRHVPPNTFSVFKQLKCVNSGQPLEMYLLFRSNNTCNIGHQSTITCNHVDHNYLNGSRVGEASNPGPTRDQVRHDSRAFRVGLINPTTVYQKEDDLLALGADILCLAETAATKSVQVAFNEAIKHTSYKMVWTLPIFDKFCKDDHWTSCSFRGEALGAAIMVRHPFRPLRDALNPVTEESRRVVSTVVNCGSFDILVISVYFQAGKTVESKVVNNLLLQDVYIHAMGTNMPFIVAGDFNIEVHRLEAFACFAAMGCIELFQYHRRTFGFDLPPTCKESTRNDTMIVHPLILPFISRIQVGDQFTFADHRPVLVDLTFPAVSISEKQWFVPKSWTLFEIDKQVFERKFRSRALPVHVTDTDDETLDPARLLNQWSHCVEQAVNDTLRHSHTVNPLRYPTPSLPRQFRGRCNRPKQIPISVPRGPRHDVTNLESQEAYLISL